MSKSLAKLFYLEQLAKTNDHHRKISKRMLWRFDVGAALIRDELLNEGYIKLERSERIGKTSKNNHFYVLTGKKFVHNKESEKKVSMTEFWPCGTKKSTGNAFDLSTAKGLFNKAELAASMNKGKPNNYNTPVQVIAYSRA